MTREMWFVGSATIQPDAFDEMPAQMRLARKLTEEQIARDLADIVGPRGGHYRQVSPVERLESIDDDGAIWIDFRVRARYVRPPRNKEGTAT